MLVKQQNVRMNVIWSCGWGEIEHSKCGNNFICSLLYDQSQKQMYEKATSTMNVHIYTGK